MPKKRPSQAKRREAAALKKAEEKQSQDDTIVLDSSDSDANEESKFVPVREGGKLLNDDTIELSDSDEEEKVLRTPERNKSIGEVTNFETPQAILDQSEDPLFQTCIPSNSTPAPASNGTVFKEQLDESLQKHSMKVTEL